ncbi:MAG TPA: GNAT family N-acetyltransferase, partial [Stellaceae bacterium]|nr:GNAT family N-acetyltransferase [Stellaceae bacterium]
MAAAGAEFPSLTTSRLRLRAPEIDDAAAFGALLGIPAVTRYSNWPDAPNKRQAERYMRWMAKLYESGKGCAWMIEDNASGSLIGAIRFNRFDKTWRYGEV